MIRGITEIGVAVRDLQAAVRHFSDVLGAVAGPIQRFEPYGMEFCMCRVGNVDFELMAPVGEGGVIAQFLERFGEGLHHVGFAVGDVRATQADLESKGMKFVDSEPRRTRFLMRDFEGQSHESDVSFTFNRPSSLFGVLMELIQYPPAFAFEPRRPGVQAGTGQ